MQIAEILYTRGYCLGPRLGKGSYAKVRMVERLSDNKIMAVKIISLRRTAKEFINKFLPRELSVILSLNHQNIIRVYEIMQTQEVVCIMMEYACRGDLLDYVKRHSVLQEDDACILFAQICKGVNYLHDRDICHRDLKCENILLRRNMTVALSDFGFSRALPTRDTLSSTYCGSAAYASPELLRGTPYWPLQNDIWSLGCIIFIMVTGQMPFCDKSTKKMMYRQLKGKVNFPEHQYVSTSCRSLIANMLEPNTDLRYNIKAVLAHPWLQPFGYSVNETFKNHSDGLQTNSGSASNCSEQETPISNDIVIETTEKIDTGKEGIYYTIPSRRSSISSNDSANQNLLTSVHAKTSLCRMPGEACIIRAIKVRRRLLRNEDNDSGSKQETPSVWNTSSDQGVINDSLSVDTNPSSSTALSSTSGDRDSLQATGSPVHIHPQKDKRRIFKDTAMRNCQENDEENAKVRTQNIICNKANELKTHQEHMGSPSSSVVSYTTGQLNSKSVSMTLEFKSNKEGYTHKSRSITTESNAVAHQFKNDISVEQEHIYQVGLVTKMRHIFESKNKSTTTND